MTKPASSHKISTEAILYPTHNSTTNLALKAYAKRKKKNCQSSLFHIINWNVFYTNVNSTTMMNEPPCMGRQCGILQNLWVIILVIPCLWPCSAGAEMALLASLPVQKQSVKVGYRIHMKSQAEAEILFPLVPPCEKLK